MSESPSLDASMLAHVRNRAVVAGMTYGEDQRAVLSRRGFEEARAEIASWPGYRPTPLLALEGLAARIGVARVLYKDESRRFGLASFKALGGAYAILRLLQARLEQAGLPAISSTELMAGAQRDIVARVTVASATDGNHGLSVAWGAGLFGCRCKIFLHEKVSPRRERRIAELGAEIVRVPGSYDDSLRACARQAEANGWALVADSDAGGGDPSAPKQVMQGYTILAQELLDQAGSIPTHVFVPVGVGGLAAAVAGHFWATLGARRPRMMAVEPRRADCLFQAIAAGALRPLDGPVDSFMAGLASGEVSPAAWPILRYAIDDVLALPDAAAAEAMRLLAAGGDGDPALVAGESGAATYGALCAIATSPDLMAELQLTEESVVVLIGSEGATDPKIYRRVVGRAATSVRAQGAPGSS